MTKVDEKEDIPFSPKATPESVEPCSKQLLLRKFIYLKRLDLSKYDGLQYTIVRQLHELPHFYNSWKFILNSPNIQWFKVLQLKLRDCYRSAQIKCSNANPVITTNNDVFFIDEVWYIMYYNLYYIYYNII